MQVPEKLSLIGGSILLASTLVFTLKSQASDILPKVDSGVSSLVHADKSGQSSNDSSQGQQDQQKQQRAQEEQTFNNNFQQAQQKGWQTGTWGTAKFYVDDQSTMHVGSGQLDGSYTNVADINKIKTISLDGSVQAPKNSHDLFATTEENISALQDINNLDHLDTSNVTSMSDMFYEDSNMSNLDLSHFDTHNVTDMYNMFSDDSSLSNLDLSHFDTHNVTNMSDMFEGNGSLSNLDLSHFDTHNVTNMEEMFFNDSSLSNLDLSHFDTSNVNDMVGMFYGDSSLSNLDLSHFDTHNVNNMYDMFDYDNIHQLSLGPNTQLQDNPSNSHYNSNLSGNYQSNGQTLNVDGNAHPGTWIKQ